MLDFNLLRQRFTGNGNISLGRQDPMTDPMYAGARRFPGQFAASVTAIPEGLKQKMLQPGYAPDVVGDRWGLQSYPNRLRWWDSAS